MKPISGLKSAHFPNFDHTEYNRIGIMKVSFPRSIRGNDTLFVQKKIFNTILSTDKEKTS